MPDSHLMVGRQDVKDYHEHLHRHPGVMKVSCDQSPCFSSASKLAAWPGMRLLMPPPGRSTQRSKSKDMENRGKVLPRSRANYPSKACPEQVRGNAMGQIVHGGAGQGSRSQRGLSQQHAAHSLRA